MPTLQTNSANSVPVGAGMFWFGLEASVPTGWLVCKGQEVSRTTYSALYALWGNMHGNGNGTTTFNMPNMQNFFPVGANAEDGGLPITNFYNPAFGAHKFLIGDGTTGATITAVDNSDNNNVDAFVINDSSPTDAPWLGDDGSCIVVPFKAWHFIVRAI